MTARRELVTTLPPDTPLPRVRGLWLAFDRDEDPERARRRFRERYGQEPREVLRCGAVLLAGPIGEGREEVRQE